MKRAALGVVFVALMLVQASSNATAQSSTINPVGTYTVSTADDEGAPLSGTMTIRTEGSGYVGVFTASDGSEVPFLQVTSNGAHIMGILDIEDSLAVTWLQRQPDGTFTGTWHPLGPGLNVKAIKKSQPK